MKIRIINLHIDLFIFKAGCNHINSNLKEISYILWNTSTTLWLALKIAFFNVSVQNKMNCPQNLSLPQYKILQFQFYNNNILVMNRYKKASAINHS